MDGANIHVFLAVIQKNSMKLGPSPIYNLSGSNIRFVPCLSRECYHNSCTPVICDIRDCRLWCFFFNRRCTLGWKTVLLVWAIIFGNSHHDYLGYIIVLAVHFLINKLLIENDSAKKSSLICHREKIRNIENFLILQIEKKGFFLFRTKTQ